jgi:hypothetical protein
MSLFNKNIHKVDDHQAEKDIYGYGATDEVIDIVNDDSNKKNIDDVEKPKVQETKINCLHLLLKYKIA